jgi:hypothetical protein
LACTETWRKLVTGAGGAVSAVEAKPSPERELIGWRDAEGRYEGVPLRVEVVDAPPEPVTPEPVTPRR